MSRPIGRAFLAAAAATATLATLGFSGVSGAGPAISQAAAARPIAGSGVSAAAVAAGQQLWTARYNNGSDDSAASVAVSPDRAKVFVTGSSYDPATREPQYATVAYSTATGEQLWVRRYAGAEQAVARAVAVSPDGTKVFVTGNSPEADGAAYITIAYSAATGAQLWFARYRGTYELGVRAASMAVSPDGTRVVVTGTGYGETLPADIDYVTVAYRTGTGTRLWARSYNGPGNGRDQAASVTVSPSGRVFVTGSSYGGASRLADYATLAYRGATGTQVWVARYNGPSGRTDSAASVAVSPDDTRVVVTGSSYSTATRDDYATVAYRTTTGMRLWTSRYNGPGSGRDAASSVKVSPSGRVFVTGSSYGGASQLADYATLAYRGATGARVWLARYNGPASLDDSAASIAVSPGDADVFVTGSSDGGTATASDYATVAYSTTTGAQAWASRYNGPGSEEGPATDAASAVTVSPNRTTVFVTGSSAGDYATVAYQVADPALAFRGLGAWVDTLDYPALNPAAVVGDLHTHGVRTLYLGTARYNSATDILYPDAVAAWLAAAHAAGIRVVGWYVPDYSDLTRDVRRTLAIASYVSPAGQRFDAIGIDIEYPLDVPSPSAWNQAVATHLARVRAGTTRPIMAIVLPPLFMRVYPDRWATFPWPAVAADTNAVAPMNYWTSYTADRLCTAGDPQYCGYQYTRDNVLLSRQLTGLPVHVIGGIGDQATTAEISDYVRAARETSAAGGSLYDYRTTKAEFWPYLEQLTP